MQLNEKGYAIMQNDIYLRRSRKIIVVPEQSKLPDAQLATAMKNIAALGFTCSPALLAALRTLSEVSFIRWYKALIHSLKMIVGAHVPYRPMYPNFPEQVMEASDAELYLNAWYHYVTNEVPEMEPINQEILQAKVKLDMIELGSEEDFRQLMRQLMKANTSISDTDKQELEGMDKPKQPDYVGHWAEASIRRVMDAGIMSGRNTGFAPNEPRWPWC